MRTPHRLLLVIAMALLAFGPMALAQTTTGNIAGTVSASGEALPGVTIEAVGAERCGGAVKALEVEFLAPDNASLVGTAKAIVNGAAVFTPNAAPAQHCEQS